MCHFVVCYFYGFHIVVLVLCVPTFVLYQALHLQNLSKNNLRHQEDIGFLQRGSARSEALVIQDHLNPISVTKII